VKRLVVMRHAKSDWDAGAETDHARPLNERGRGEAPRVAAKLSARGFTPTRVTSSDSARTTETLELSRPIWPTASIVMTSTFYLAGIEAVRAAAVDVPAEVETWLVLGHNPGWEDLASTLAARPIELKTSWAAVLESQASTFVEALSGSMTLIEIVKP